MTNKIINIPKKRIAMSLFVAMFIFLFLFIYKTLFLNTIYHVLVDPKRCLGLRMILDRYS